MFVLSALLATAVAENIVQVELRGGPNEQSGRVTVQLDNGVWVQVCDTDFSGRDAAVVCRQLGYDTDGLVNNAQYGIGGEPIGVTSVACRGEETSLRECSFRSTTSGCTHGIAGVDCSPTVGTTGSLGLEAGIIAAILIVAVAVIGVGIGLGVCLYRNDLIPWCSSHPSV